MRVAVSAAARAGAVCAMFAIASAGRPSIAAQSSGIESLWLAFWRADSPKAAATEAEKLLKAGVAFDDAFARLKKGRTYSPVNPGPRAMRFTAPGGAAYDNTVDVPAAYDPARRWPLRVKMHGGVVRQDPE